MNEQNKAIHNSNAPNAYQSAIYAPGSEFALTQCLAQLMGAVVCVQLGGLTDTIKGFYKIRKAYITLDGIMQMEQRFLQDRAAASTVASSRVSSESADQLAAGTDTQGSRSSGDSEVKSSTLTSSKHSQPIFQLGPDEKEAHGKQTPRSSNEKLSTKDKDPVHKLTSKLPKLSVSTGDLKSQGEAPASAPPRQEVENPATLSNDPDSDIFNHPIDAYIHSGANLCFGVLLIVISMAPPTFSKLLSIIGFRGDKEMGLRMLWQASKFHSINGAIAALAVLGYYNAFVRFCDIVADDGGEDGDVEGYPIARLSSLLSDVRARYPTSQLWLLEESRMHSANRRLDKGLQLLSEGKKSPLKQVEMLHTFEKSLDAMYLHEYEICAESFLEVCEFLGLFKLFFSNTHQISFSVLTSTLARELYIITLPHLHTFVFIENISRALQTSQRNMQIRLSNSTAKHQSMLGKERYSLVSSRSIHSCYEKLPNGSPEPESGKSISSMRSVSIQLKR